jgi:hypothetical protein
MWLAWHFGRFTPEERDPGTFNRNRCFYFTLELIKFYCCVNDYYELTALSFSRASYGEFVTFQPGKCSNYVQYNA